MSRALTSALVGQFWWAGRFEALGDEDEGELIVPDLKVDSRAWLERSVVGLSGPISAGKTTAAQFLGQRGCHYARFSLVLAELLKERGLQVTRESLQQIGQEIHDDPGQRWLCKQLASRLPSSGDIVIDGLRHPEDHSYLVERFGPAFVHIHIDAPIDVRSKRYTYQGYGPADLLRAAEHPVESSVESLRELAHRRINNADDVRLLETRLRRAVRRHSSKGK